MALSDPFDTTYAGAYKAGTSLGEGIQSAAGDVAKQMELQKNRKNALNMLKQFGMVDTKTEEPSLDELAQGAKDFAKQQGSDLNINMGDNPDQAKQNILGIYKALNIPMPQGKTTTTLNLAPGTSYDPVKGDVSFSGQYSLPQQIQQMALANKMLSQTGLDNVQPRVSSKGVSLAPALGTTRQDKLEKQAGDYMNKVISYRSGGLGLQDSKVNQAIDLRTLVNQSKDPTTGEYKLSPAFQSELVLGLARLMSPSGNVGVQLEQELSQKTAKEGLANMLIYFGGDPKEIGGSTQSVIKAYIDAIDRQGLTSEQLRDKYTEGIKQRAEFSGLNDDARKRILDSSLGSSYKEFLKNGKFTPSESKYPDSYNSNPNAMTDAGTEGLNNSDTPNPTIDLGTLNINYKKKYGLQ